MSTRRDDDGRSMCFIYLVTYENITALERKKWQLHTAQFYFKPYFICGSAKIYSIKFKLYWSLLNLIKGRNVTECGDK